MESRFYTRVPVKNFTVDASDGDGFFQGMVQDVSRFGVCIKNLPQRINDKAKRIIIVVSGDGRNFKMLARPCWGTLKDSEKSLGAELLNPPWGWTAFVASLEPKRDQGMATINI
jgi:hypothetical protein